MPKTLTMPPNDPTREQPLDYPVAERPHRVYVALTNHCNRACPWCSTCSSPAGSTFLTTGDFSRALPAEGLFQIQLEGGEPTIHPQFWEFVRIGREHPRCTHVVLCTNGAVIPRQETKLREYMRRLGTPVTIKLSVNHYLLEHDVGLIGLARDLRSVFRELGPPNLFVINVRLRRGVENDDRKVRAAIEEAGLLPDSNVFFLQRYGFASDRVDWESPAPVWDNFRLVNPNGEVFGPDLVARSEAMRVLP